ncbi:hypothetical protein M752DRAFT_158492 [Aspergillus phoenicis ATCC 13157]|uniref:Uncharacterized protein n=1 Tax=Aspergillus phoenicis ATCC 13157 TaxID=1353007 RepID=A0A370PMW5_ASPPH|nr:hypothetical protein M752DRAFT_158492 [Aspergillus phoenicis ATCC 13157]
MTYACRILDKAQKTGGKANEENPKIGATQEKRNAKRGVLCNCWVKQTLGYERLEAQRAERA